MSDQQREDQQRNAGANSTTLLCDFDIYRRQVEYKILPEGRSSRDVENRLSDIRGANLKEIDNSI